MDSKNVILQDGIFEPYEGDKPYIFISYKHEDAEVVFKIMSEMNKRGYRIWYDNGICVGDVLENVIAEKILNCDVMFCFLSQAYETSDYCMRELAYAKSMKKKIVPIIIEDYELAHRTDLKLTVVKRTNLKDFPSDIKLVDHLCKVNKDLLKSCREKPVYPEREKNSGSINSDDNSKPDESQTPPSSSTPQHGIASSIRKAKDILTKMWSGRNQHQIQEEHQKKTGVKDTVNFSVLSPKAVKTDSYGVIHLHVYTDSERKVVDDAIRNSNVLVNEARKNGFDIARSTSVTVRLESEDAKINDSIETQTWNGTSLHFDFLFYVDNNYTRSQLSFICYVELNGIPVTRLNFLVAVLEGADSNMIPAVVTREDFKKAFISYSRKDEQRMLSRVLGIQELAPEMCFWLDKQSMDAGVQWREEIRKAILISDVLLLFWSVFASKSEEVEKEWEYALDHKGLSFIAPVPLDPPNICPPPKKLEALNFTVREFSQNEITDKLTFYDSNNILIVK